MVEIKSDDTCGPINVENYVENPISQELICLKNRVIDMGTIELKLNCSQNHETFFMKLVPNDPENLSESEKLQFDSSREFSLGECKERDGKKDCECKCKKCKKFSSQLRELVDEQKQGMEQDKTSSSREQFSSRIYREGALSEVIMA